MLELLISGVSIREVARWHWPSRHTIGRWWHWLEREFNLHSLHLRSRFPEFGRMEDWKAFWSRCFEHMSLSVAMGWLDRVAVAVP